MKIKHIIGLPLLFGLFVWFHSNQASAAPNTTCTLRDSQLLISFQDNSVVRYNADTMSTIDSSYFTLTPGINHPHEAIVVAEDTLWQANNTSVTPVTLSTGATGATINVGGTPEGMTLGPDGAVYAFVRGPAVTRTETTPPYTTTTIINAGDGGFVNEPFNAASLGIAFGPDGHLYVISTRNTGSPLSSIKRFNGTTFAYMNDFVAEQPGDWQDFGFHTDGYIYVAAGDGGVLRFDAQTGVYVDQYSNLTSSYSIKFAPNGNLLLTRLSNNVHLFTGPNTETTVFSPTGPLTKIAMYLPPACYDWGDAASTGAIGANTYSHPILAAANGARHLIQFDAIAGTIIDTETNGQPTSSANGDDITDDEDGLTLSVQTVRAGETVSATFVANGRGVASPQDCARYLNIWVDLNGDGDWNDVGEQVVDGEGLGYSCSRAFTFVPTASDGPIMIRTRYSSVRDLAPTGGAPDGEVEDYILGVATQSSPVPVPNNSTQATTAVPGAPKTGVTLMRQPVYIGVFSMIALAATLAIARKYQS